LDVARSHHRADRLALAEAAYRAVLVRDPDNAGALHLLGMLCHESGRQDEAIVLLLRAVELSPAAPHFRCNLAAVLGACGRAGEAIPHLREAIRLRPSIPQLHNNLGVSLEAIDRLAEADAAYREALRLDAAYAEAHFNLGNVLQKRGDVAGALARYLHVLELKANHGGALNNAAGLFCESGRSDEAVACYRRLVALRPYDGSVHSSLLYTLHYLAGSDARSLYAEHVAWGERHAAPLRNAWLPHENDRSPGRRLRVGYVSPDFRSHPVSRFFEPVLRSRDRGQFHVTCYSDVERSDEVTARLRGLADGWRDTRGVSDQQVSTLIRDDRIDILVDLTGHMADNRLLVFARKPAPVQVSYLGYPDTTGVEAIDYRVTDSIHDPPGETEQYHVERLVRLDPCCWCYEPDDFDAPGPVGPPPVLRNGFMTFVCLNDPE
jgi:predicted O-linked N-acetylglucosamine transferase (SPINDLY family)